MAVFATLHQRPLPEFLLRASLSVAAAVVAVYLIVLILERLSRVKAPRIGKSPGLLGLAQARADFVKNGKAITKLGYDRYKDGMYWVQTGDMERLVIPNRYVDELRKMPDHVIDSRYAVVERNMGWYNGIDIILRSTMHVHVCRTQLVQHLAKITEGQVEQLPRVFGNELGSKIRNGELQYFPAASTIFNIINRVVARTLVGEPLCHNETWLTNSLETTMNIGMHCKTLQSYPALLRPLVNVFLKTRRDLQKSSALAEELLKPVVDQRKPGDKNYDILQWLIDATDPKDFSMPFLTQQTVFLVIASVRSTSNSIVNALFDVIEHRECQDTLRHEIEQALDSNGGWCLAAVQKMHKLDSFIKESQRLNHQLLLSFNRRVQRTVTLSDGLTLPAGTFITTPAYWTARDADFFAGGDDFRPWRWDELREQAEREGRSSTAYLASSTSAENLHWGFGRNACPGRFMAAAELKLIIAWILFNYDISFPDGQTRKPESISVDERVLPDPNQKIGFQLRRQVK